MAANPKHVKIVKKGAEAIAEWRRSNPRVRLNLHEADLRKAALSGANLSRAKISGANLSGADLIDADLSGANLIGANLIEADLSASDLCGAGLTKANLFSANLTQVKLIRADLSVANLIKAHLAQAKLVGADLFGADFTQANLSGADLDKAKLVGVNLTRANLRGATLLGANISRADLFGADLTAADLTAADLTAADLTAADLSRANLLGADLTAANLTRVSLLGANLTKTNLDRANLSESVIWRTVFADLDLSCVGGLESVKHNGPSSIGIDTLYRSRGLIPDVFLRGCGLPDALIAYLPSLLGTEEAIQYYSCFISYSHKDEEFANRLHSRMRDEHLRVWFAPEDIKGGRKLHEQIEQAIRVYDKLLLVLSETSMKSEWVATEIYHARQREIKEKRKVLFPITLVPFETIKAWKCFDADTGKEMAREIREYFIPDFADWKDHDCFEAGFKRLLEDLKADASSGG